MDRLRFGHISDTHLIASPEGTMLKLVQAGGNPQKNLEVALAELATERLDFLIMTGDNCHEGDAEAYANLRETLERYLPKVPVIAAMGNHDVRDAFRKGFLGDAYGGEHPYCDTLTVGGVRIIAIDTAFEKLLTGTLGTDQLDWLEETIKTPSQNGDILIFHHPMCNELSAFGMEMPPRLERIIRGGRFIGMFNGHVHRICTGYAAGVPHITGQSLAFDIEVLGRHCDYTTRGGYNFGMIDEEGHIFVESRIVSPKGEVFNTKDF